MGFALSDMTLTSSGFDRGEPIPTKHTGEDEDVSPVLSWRGQPEGTRSFALICHDPDAPLVKPGGTYGFVHWVLYGIPGSIAELPEGVGDYIQASTILESQVTVGRCRPRATVHITTFSGCWR